MNFHEITGRGRSIETRNNGVCFGIDLLRGIIKLLCITFRLGCAVTVALTDNRSKPISAGINVFSNKIG